MNKMKLYFREGDEICYDLEYQYDHMRLEEIDKMKVFEAVTEKGTGLIWCNDSREIGEKEYCSKQCRGYKPRNGKGGICTHHRTPLAYGKSKIIKIDL